MTSERPSGRARSPKPPLPTPDSSDLVGAARALVEALREHQKLEPADELRARLVLALCAQLDAGAGLSTAAVGRELRAALEELPRAPRKDSVLDTLQREAAERRLHYARQAAEAEEAARYERL